LAVKLPFDFGEIVYHKVRPDLSGMVDGFQALPGAVKARVRWGNDLFHQLHYAFELTTDPPKKPEERKD